jgi:hypothetical protein
MHPRPSLLTGCPSSQLLPRYGFAKTIRLTGAIIPPVLVLGNLMMRTRLPPRSKRGANAAPPNIKSFFVEPAYIFTVVGCAPQSSFVCTP